MFILRLIIEEFGPESYYIQGNKNMVADVLSLLTSDGNQNNTHESNYLTETM